MITTSRISRRVQDVVIQRLSDKDTGFNAALTAAAADYKLRRPFEIDWTDRSPNFHRGPNEILDLYDPEDDNSLPALSIYRSSSRNTGAVVFGLFSGPVRLCVDVHLIWSEGTADGDFETLTDIVEDAMYYTFLSDPQTPLLTNGMNWNGDIGLNPGPVIQQDAFTLRTMQFQLGFLFHTN